MINFCSSITKRMIPGKSFHSKHFSTLYKKISEITNDLLQQPWILTTMLVLCFSLTGYAQKNNRGNSNKNNDIVPVLRCVKDLRNGTYQASFGYNNPTRKEVTVNEDGSIIKSNNGKRVAKGLNKFKPGSVDKVFTKEFGPGDYVEWTIISNGKTHTVIANANSAKKCAPDDGIIEPVIGNGKSFDLIGQELTSLCEGIAGEIPSPLIFQIDDDGKVLVEIVPIEGEFEAVIDLLKGITPACSTITSPFGVPDTDFLLYDQNKTLKDALAGLTAIDAYITNDVLCSLNDYACVINFARPVYPSIKHSFDDGDTGNAVSQGDATQASDVVRESFRLIDAEGILSPVDGTGITIGVMSNSYDTQAFSSGNDSKATLDIAAGDLPEDVTVLKEYPYGEASDEGRAMMHIIHDVAPGAALAFYTGSLSPRNFEVGFNGLAGFNDLGLKSNLIVDDITFITEPFFGEGRISSAIKAFTEDGGIHFTSAGNFADNGYQSIFSSSSDVPSTNFIDTGSATKAHVFGTDPIDGSEDYLQKISVVPGTYLIALQWKELAASQDNGVGANTDLDIYIVDDLGRLLVGSNRVNSDGIVDGIEGDPTEIIVFRATGSGTANILITSANGATNVPFRYIAFQSNGLTFNEWYEGAPTISGHAMTYESVTVGAIRYNQTVPESFSSYGGTLKDGSTVGVDFAAPDGVDTNVGSIGIKYFQNDVPVDDTPLFPNFFGTSSAAPHAAAAVALLQSALPTWYPNGYDGDIIELFKANTKGSVNEIQAGAGMIDVNKVFNSLASQTAKITSFTFLPETDEINASKETVKIKIIGEFFPPTPPAGETIGIKVLLDGVELTGTIKDDGSIEVDIPPFSGRPVLQIFTEPKEGSLGNGGLSEPYDFFQDGRIALLVTGNPSDTENEDGSVTQNPVTIKFGQEYKSKLTYTIKGMPEGGFKDENGDPIQFEDIFPEVLLTTTVDDKAYPDVNNYPITPSFSDEAYDKTKYIVNFKNGDLVIEKNYLRIKPDNQNLTYGDVIPNNLTYQLIDADGNPISNEDLNQLYADTPGFYSYISAAHQLDFNPTNTNYLIINDFKALINDWDWEAETNDFKALINTWKALINDWKALINDANFEIILEGSSWTSTEKTIENDFKPLINGMNYINLEPSHFRSYSTHLNDFKPLINDFKPLINDFKALVNRSEFAGDIYLNDFKPLINDFKPLINDFKALINDSSALFTIISTDDSPSVEFPDNMVSPFYAINLVTGIHVYEEAHYILPGSLINDIEANLEITYDPGRLTINPKTLTVKTAYKKILYGEALTSSDLITEYEGLVNDEEVREVFSNSIPYYFVKVGGDGTELEFENLKELGEYTIKIRDPQNYLMEYDIDHRKLTISALTIMAETAPAAAFYGTEIKNTDLSTEFGDFAFSDDAASVFPDGIPYYFEDENLNRFELGDKMPIGLYTIKIDITDKYLFDYGENRGFLTINQAPLTVETEQLTVEYGEPVLEAIADKTSISGFASDEGLGEPLDVYSGGIPYLFVKGTDDPLGIDAVKALGTYVIEVEAPISGNYVIDYAYNHGDLTITEAILTFTPVAITIGYGQTPVIEPYFDGFAPEEDATVLEIDGKMPYYFVKDGTEYFLGDKMDVGVYDIFIIDDIDDNYIFPPVAILGNLTIEKANLDVVIDDLIINQGESPEFTSVISGFVLGESVSTVFPDGVQYYFVDEYGDEQDNSATGVFTIKIRDPKNYLAQYILESNLYINPYGTQMKKIRNYLDCIVYSPDDPSGFDYVAKFRYENPNDNTLFADGADNNISGDALYSGELPIVFLPGEGSFEILFDGNLLKWNLTTFESTHKTSTSASANADSGKCSGGVAEGDPSYTVFPNPVQTVLTIQQNVSENSNVDIYNLNGVLKYHNRFNKNGSKTKYIDMTSYLNGFYYVKITTNKNEKVYNIIKQ